MSTWKTMENPYPNIDWEQRRYEIAKDAMCAMISNKSALTTAVDRRILLINNSATMATVYADALIEELKK